MKLSIIAALCKKRKYVVIFSHPDSDDQFVTDGRAIYKLEGLPFLTVDALLKIFDVSEKEKDKWFAEEREMPNLCFDDNMPGERLIEKVEEFPEVSWFGIALRPLSVSSGVLMIKSEYLKPLGNSKYIQLFERKNEYGSYIAVKDGLYLKAIILPQMPKELRNLLNDLCAGVNKWCSMNVDPETGEVIDDAQQTV